MGTIFPFPVENDGCRKGYIEMPYTLPQDFTLFVVMKEKTIDIWKQKLDWIAEKGGMALLNTHPDYMSFNPGEAAFGEYPATYYLSFLEYIATRHAGSYWNMLPRKVAAYWSGT